MDKIKSRKFWVGLIGATLPYIAKIFSSGVSWRDAMGMSTIAVVSYIIGQGAVDTVKELRNGG